MNIFTHLGISRGIMAVIERNLGIKLDGVGFVLGNIKPDIDPKLSSVPHLKNTVMDYVSSEIKSLLSMEDKIKNRCTREFSERLGLITHYLSDFFCYAHSEYFKGNILKHCIYESKLSKYCRKNKVAAAENIKKRITYIDTDLVSILGYIDNMHNEYLNAGNKASCKRDMKYTMEMAASFCISVIKSYISEEINTAA